MENSEREKRIGKFRVDSELEAIIKGMNDRLDTFERELLTDQPPADQPILFFCYPPRCGSTLISQHLASSGSFAYISNLIARFWKAPLVGANVEKNLKLGIWSDQPFTPSRSLYGVTRHVAEPHEFGFFWNQLLTSSSTHRIDAQAVEKATTERMLNELRALAAFAKRPLFIKNGIAGMNPGLMKTLFPEARFLVVKRNPVFIAQSLFEARRQLYGDPRRWWSLMPENKGWITETASDECEEIVLQIKHVYRHIEEDIQTHSLDHLEVEYEAFCAKPAETIRSIVQFCGAEHRKYAPSASLKTAESMRIEEPAFRKIVEYVKKHFE